MANADATVTDTNEDMNIEFGPETGTPPDTGTVAPQMETATATERTQQSGQTAVTVAQV